jgi:anti-sigma factor RsiW
VLDSGRSIRSPFADPGRAEPPVWAYCRELCGPTGSERAVAATLAALGNGAGASVTSQDGLLRLTRATAAKHASDGLNGKVSRGESLAVCLTTPARLVARAQNELAPGDQRELKKHLQGCLVCKATGIKMTRAERVFAVMDAGMAATSPEADPAQTAAGAFAASPPPGVNPLQAGLESGRDRAAVRAYCRELCDPTAIEVAVAASVAGRQGSNGAPAAGWGELLRTTRVVAAKHVLDCSNGSKRNRQCIATPARLAALANGELDRGERRELREHLQQCMACQATKIKMDRAERAFATMAPADIATEPRSEPIAPRLEPIAPRPQPIEPQPQPIAPRLQPAAEPITWQRASAAEATATALAAAAAAKAAGATAAPAPAHARPRSRPPRERDRQRRAGLIGVAVLATVAILAVVAAALVLDSGSSSPTIPHVQAVVKTPATSTPSHVTTTRHPAKPKSATHRAAKPHRAAAKAHRTVKPKPTPAVHIVASVPVRPVTVTPVAPRRAVTPVVVAKPPAAKPSTPSVTPQGGSLPAQSAPTKGIGSK